MRQIQLFILSCILLYAHTGAAEPEAVEFLRANIDGEYVVVQPPRSVDWATFAPRVVDSSEVRGQEHDGSLGSIDLRTLPRTTNEYGQHASTTFNIPTPEWVEAYSYYLVSSDGVIELQPGTLRGAISATWNHRDTEWVQPIHVDYRGHLVSLPLSLLPTATGGIVIATSNPVDISTNESSISLLDVLHLKRGCDCTEQQHADSALTNVRLVARYGITVAEKDYLFIAWSPDHTCSSGEPNYYFKLVDAHNMAKDVAFSSAVWPQAN